ncbi:hypothetical protein CWM61_09055 [Klebsiella sp. K-Nf6]|nr:hypothetical protein CWM61_09055 [Klebsiella sp. K-Nf6]
MTTDITELALITKIKKQLENFDTVVLKEAEAKALVEALEKAQQHIARQEQIILNQDESLSIRRGELEKAQRANAAQDDHINQQQDRIESLEKKNAELGKYSGNLEDKIIELHQKTEIDPRTHEIIDLKERIAALTSENAALKDSVENAAGCINAAYTEGLIDVLAESSDERLVDLVKRRLLFAYLPVEAPATDDALVAMGDAVLLEQLEDSRKAIVSQSNIIAELESRTVTPVTYSENADADYCRKWAWEQVKDEVSTEDWTTGDSITYFGFFCWGWDMRRQYNEQRPVTVKIPYLPGDCDRTEAHYKYQAALRAAGIKVEAE